MSHDLTRPHDWRVIRLYGEEPIKVSYHSAKFGVHRHCGSEYIMFLSCHVFSQVCLVSRDHTCLVILQDHVIKESMWLYGQEPIKVNYHLAKFGGHWQRSCADIMILIYHMILQDLVIKGSCDFMARSPLR